MIFTVLGAIIFIIGLYQLTQFFRKLVLKNKNVTSGDYKVFTLGLIMLMLGTVVFSYKTWNIDQQNPPNRTKISVSISKKEVKLSSKKARKAQKAAIKRGSIAAHISSANLTKGKPAVSISNNFSGKEKLSAGIRAYSQNKMINSVTIAKETTIRLNKQTNSLSKQELVKLSAEITGQFKRWSKQYNISENGIVIYSNSGKIIKPD